MESSDDWCFFQKIGNNKSIGISRPDGHCDQLISVNNRLGWVFIACKSDLLVLKASQIIEYFTGNRNPLTIKFDSNITQIAADSKGNTLAVARDVSLELLNFNHAVAGQKTSSVVVLTAPIRRIQWKKDRMAVLTLDNTLQLYLNNSKEAELANITAFSFITPLKCAVCTENTIRILKIPSLESESSIPSPYHILGLFSTASHIYVHGLKGCITLTVLNHSLGVEAELESIDSLAFSPQPFLENNLESLPLISYFKYIPSRNTLLFSSSCSVTLDLLVRINESHEILNFEYNVEGQLKTPWFENKECVFRGFGLIKSHNPAEEFFEFNVKDSEYRIKQPPLVISLANNGDLMLRRFVDLRSEYLMDDLCKRGVGSNEEVKVEQRKVEEKKAEERKVEVNLIKSFEQAKVSGVIEAVKLGEKADQKKGTEVGLFSAAGLMKSTEETKKGGFFVTEPEQKKKDFNISAPLMSADSGASSFFKIRDQAAKPAAGPPLMSADSGASSFFKTPDQAAKPISNIFDSLKSNIAKPLDLKPAGFAADSQKPSELKPSPFAPLQASKPLEFSQLTGKPADKPSAFQASLQNLPASKPFAFQEPTENPFKDKSSSSQTVLSSPFASNNPLASKPVSNQPAIDNPFAPRPISSEPESKKDPFNPPASNPFSAQARIGNSFEPSSLLSKPEVKTPFDPSKPESTFPLAQKPSTSTKQAPFPSKLESTSLNAPAQPVTSNLTTISATLIDRQNKLINSYLNTLRTAIADIHSRKISEDFYADFSKKLKQMSSSITALKADYKQKLSALESFCANLEEYSSDVNYLTSDSHQNIEFEENLDIRFKKSAEEICKSVENLEKYIEDGMMNVSRYYKEVKSQLGIKESGNGLKKTRSFVRKSANSGTLDEETARNILESRVKELEKRVNILDLKSKGGQKLGRKTQQKVIKFELEDSDEEFESSEEFVDPDEYKKLFRFNKKGK